MSQLKREEILSINQKGWNQVAPMFYGGTALAEIWSVGGNGG